MLLADLSETLSIVYLFLFRLAACSFQFSGLYSLALPTPIEVTAWLWSTRRGAELKGKGMLRGHIFLLFIQQTAN